MVVYVEPMSSVMRRPGEGKWRVSRVGNTISTHRTKSKAIEVAKREAGPNEQVAVRGESGPFEGVIPGID